MPNPNPVSNRALVRYQVNKAPPASGTAGAPVSPTGSQSYVEFELDQPTHSVAEVEKRWRDANPGKEFIDADLLPVQEPAAAAEPVLANPTIPASGTPTDPQIIRERAAGREELPGTVTEDEDLKKTKGRIRPASGGGGTATATAKHADESPVSDTNADEAIASIGNMRSRDRLQHIIDNDPRVTVKDAAEKRLASLGGT